MTSSSSSRIPPLMEPYLTIPPESSLTVFTSVLGATTNWLVLRELHAMLAPQQVPHRAENGEGRRGPVQVLLVSFLRDLAFWTEGAARLGLDLPSLARRGRFAFVDGMGGLFFPHDAETRAARAALTPGLTMARSVQVPDLGRTLHGALEGLRERGRSRTGGAEGRVILVMDQLDFVLAAAGGEVQEGRGESYLSGFREMVLGLREKVHATVLTLAADEPLITPQMTPLEKLHANFVLSQSHEADMVLSLRRLDTGAARDVSGVVRITRGGQTELRTVEEKEYLYHVAGDGSVQVFERGQ